MNQSIKEFSGLLNQVALVWILVNVVICTVNQFTAELTLCDCQPMHTISNNTQYHSLKPAT